MGIRGRVVKALGGTELIGDPASIVEIGTVELAISEIAVMRLRDAGFVVDSVPESRLVEPSALSLRPMARIFCRLDQSSAATDLLNSLFT
jgi:hypothetical protein